MCTLVHYFSQRWEKARIARLICSLRGFPCGSVVKNPVANAGDPGDTVRSLSQEDPLEEEIATHSSILAWKILWTEEPGRL